MSRSKGQNFLLTKLVFKHNDALSDKHEKCDQLKARLGTRCFGKVYGVDYNEEFATVMRLTKLKLFSFLVASEDVELHQMDVKSVSETSILPKISLSSSHRGLSRKALLDMSAS